MSDVSSQPTMVPYDVRRDAHWSAEWGSIDRIIERALGEDLAAGDVTSRATVDAASVARAEIVAKQALIVAGLPIASRVFYLVDPSLRIEIAAVERKQVAKGQIVLAVEGCARSILAAERTALNLLQRSCGIATLTWAYVDAAKGRMRVVDTRKTMPGLRALDRYAVRCGGGQNHRNDLGSGILIKENHIRCAGGIEAAVRAAKQNSPHGLKVECEVTSLDEANAAVLAGADALLLDNMSDKEIAQAVERWKGTVILEVSGGITLARIETLSTIGVDLVSVGALTHSVPAADLSLLVQIQ